MKKRFLLAMLLLGMASIMLYGCSRQGSEPDDVVVVEPAPEPEPVPEPELPSNPEGMARSLTTGEWIDEEIAKHRPYAIMLGNTTAAIPQFSISHADVVYEIPVEGALTRLMGIYQDVSGLDKIGSMRSCRHYFIFFALEFDAFYVHYGQTIYADPILARPEVNNISGMDGSIASSFYRDPNRQAPHNAFTSAEGLAEAVAKKGYRADYEPGNGSHYLFAPDDAPIALAGGEDALVVSPGFRVNKPWFVYDPDTGLYRRFQYKGKQIDAAENDEQIAYQNIIIQNNKWSWADENGYLNVYSVGEGTGRYITNGKMIDVTWSKQSEEDRTRYFDLNGQELMINQGKTWVCIQLDSDADRFKTYRTQEELVADHYN